MFKFSGLTASKCIPAVESPDRSLIPGFHSVNFCLHLLVILSFYKDTSSFRSTYCSTILQTSHLVLPYPKLYAFNKWVTNSSSSSQFKQRFGPGLFPCFTQPLSLPFKGDGGTPCIAAALLAETPFSKTAFNAEVIRRGVYCFLNKLWLLHELTSSLRILLNPFFLVGHLANNNILYLEKTVLVKQQTNNKPSYISAV